MSEAKDTTAAAAEPAEKAEEKDADPEVDEFDLKRQESIDFLSGKREKTAWHGPIESETKNIAAALVRINQLGLLTVSSQPGLFERFDHDGTEERNKTGVTWAAQHGPHIQLAVKTEKYSEIRQRAFVECICLCEDVVKVVDALVARGLWVHCFGEACGSRGDVVLSMSHDTIDLTTTTVVTTEGYEAVAADTKSHCADSLRFPDDIFPGNPGDHYGMMIMDPLFRRNTLFDIVVEILTALRAEGKITAHLIT